MSGVQIQGIKQLFPSPIYHFSISNFEELNKSLLDEILKIKNQSPGIARSNRKGWHSNTDLFKRQEPSFRRLCDSIIHSIKLATSNVSPNTDFSKYDLITSGWININGKGAYNAPHEHGDHTWSGVYYVRIPNQLQSDSGLLYFLNPRSGSSSLSVPGAAFSASGAAIRPQAGALILFPSYLRHWVTPNVEDEERVSIAFNALLRSQKY